MFEHSYRPPKKLWEGIVFSRVCLSTGWRVSVMLPIANDALDLTVQGLPPCPSPPSVMVAKAGDLFKLVHFRTSPPPRPPVLTSGGYGREASGIHPTLMFSCCVKKFT